MEAQKTRMGAFEVETTLLRVGKILMRLSWTVYENIAIFANMAINMQPFG
jgi:hypothetical protein